MNNVTMSITENADGIIRIRRDSIENSSNSHQAADSSGDHPITFKDMGIRRDSLTRLTIFGKARTWHRFSRLEKVYLLVSLISLIATASLTIERMATLPKNTGDFTYAIVLFVNTLVMLYFLLSGLFYERFTELVAFAAATALVFGYVIFNYAEGAPETRTAMKTVRLVIIVVFAPAVFAVGLYVARELFESKDLIFRIVGGNLNMQSACRNLFVTESLVKFDFQLAISMVILILGDNGRVVSTRDKVILGIGIPFAIIWTILTIYAINREHKFITWGVLGTSWCVPAYVIYKIFESTKHLSAGKLIPVIVFAVGFCALVIRVLLLVSMYFVVTFYGNGLKEKLLEDGKRPIAQPHTIAQPPILQSDDPPPSIPAQV